MSGAIGTYSFINAKVRTKRSFLLSDSNLRKLAETRTIQDFFTSLSHSRFRQFVEKARGLDAEAVEFLLQKEEIHELQSIIKKSPKVPRQLTRLLLQRYDLERLKELLRVWHQKLDPHGYSFADSIVTDFPVDSVLQSERFSDVVHHLSGTLYHKVLENQTLVYENQKSLFSVELALDKDLFRRIDEVIQALLQKDREIARRLFGLEIDLKNIQWLFRFRTYYSINKTDLSDYLIPRGYQFNPKDFTLSKDVPFGTLIQDILQEKHQKIPETAGQEKDLTQMERFLYTLLKQEAYRAFRQFPFSIGSLLGYYYLLRIEMKNLRTLIEAKRYNLSSEQSIDLLVL